MKLLEFSVTPTYENLSPVSPATPTPPSISHNPAHTPLVSPQMPTINFLVLAKVKEEMPMQVRSETISEETTVPEAHRPRVGLGVAHNGGKLNLYIYFSE